MSTRKFGFVRLQLGVYFALLASFAMATRPEPASAGPSTVPTGFADQSMAFQLDTPVGIAEVPGQQMRMLFVEQFTARVRLLAGSTVSTVGTVPNVSTNSSERGLLGITVDPGWPARPYLYVHYTDNRSGNKVAISRFTVTGDLSYTDTGSLQFNSSSRYDLIRNIPDNAGNHNGGTVRFGPDEQLYVSIGDDAAGCLAQDITFMGGKILRLDVSRLPATGTGPPPLALLIAPGNPFTAQADSGAMLVWSYGLRNPFRFSIDALTGTLYIGDVGENAWEELSRVPTGGVNLGWPLFEGSVPFISCPQTPPSSPAAPIYSYDHAQGVVIITAGLYRVPGGGAGRFPAGYEGDCFFLDYATGFMRRLKGSGTSWAVAPPEPGQPSSSNWGEDFNAVSDVVEATDGTLWYCRQSNGGSLTGELRRIAWTQNVAVEPGDDAQLALRAPQPNPSPGSALLRWSQPRRDRVWLTIFDLGGRAIRTLQDGDIREAGAHEQLWDGRNGSGQAADPGIYFASLEVGGARRQVRISLVR